MSALRRLWVEGYVAINFEQERGTNKWHVEARKFIKIEGDQ